MGIFKNSVFILLFSLLSQLSFANQGFLHADGKKIVNGNGENVLLRGIGTGNWMLMEGYMMKTSGFAGTQHEFTKKLEAIIGKEKTDEFFDAWLKNHFTRTDVDSMKAWGFNSVRVAMHYKWFTPPIEDEPVKGEITWIDKGFVMIDSLLQWCKDNEMYLILDLHGAPGGQGANADISDYDKTKPSLWESVDNKNKTIALWRKLAERYANETWIGGYDLINETNWTFPEGNNSQMRDLFGKITKAIREVDTNHILFIEGNSWANDYSGLTPPWDDNMAYSFHKYWSGTSLSDLDWVTKDIRDRHNVPIWMGESGENSNVWYAEFISSCEKSNIGWSFWPVKKNGLNNVLYVKINEGYEKLVNRSMSKTSDPVETFDAVMQWAENHKIQNCEVKYDVLDAMLRQPLSEETIPFVKHNALDTISFSDYDLGRIGFAYSDKDFANYGGDFVPWNTGWNYRSDGVDIESCSDLVSNGYSVGWTSKDEWMVFTLEIDSTAVYSFDIRYAASPASGKFQLQLDGIEISNIESLKSTGDWYNWATHTVQDIILTKGKHQLKFYIVDAGFNLNYFRFYNPRSLTAASAEFLQIKTDEPGETIQLVSNLGYMANELPTANDFELLVNNKMVSITDISIDVQNPKILNLKTSIALIKADKLTLSYLGTSLKSPEGKGYPTFTKRSVVNNSPFYFVLPTRIQAEDFKVNNGFQLENCEDTGGGFNLSYASSGDYADYQVYLSEAGKFQFEYRVASGNSGSFKMKLITEEGETDLHIISASTGGWQKWQSKTATANLPAGKFTLRIYVLSGEFNLNWFRISVATSNLIIEENMNELVVTYSMKGDILTIHNSTLVSGKGTLELFNSQGQKVIAKDFQLYGDRSIEIPVNKMSKGVYFTRITMGENRFKQRFLVN